MLHRALSIRFIRFGIVGIGNTIVDFVILNILVFAAGFDKLPANVISVSCAMLVSYALNHSFVFRSTDQNHAKRLVPFVAVSAFGLFVIQNVIIYIFVHWLTLPADMLYFVQSALHLDLGREFVNLNTAKAAATAATMLWNYMMYKHVVFRTKNSSDASISD